MKTKILILVVFGLFASGCTDAEATKRALAGAGYTNVQTGGYAFFGGSKEDFYNTKFTATGPNGKPVSGVVSKGLLFRGATIRLD